MNKIKISFVFFVALALFIAGCSLEAPTEKQTVLKTCTGNFASYVALGNSITAGFQSAALTQKHQIYSYPNLLAEQMGVSNFEQPLLAYPGLGSWVHLQLIRLEFCSWLCWPAPPPVIRLSHLFRIQIMMLTWPCLT